MVRSWDNLSAKGIIRYVTDVVVVNNELIKQEALRWNFVPAERIRIIGIPHYDGYVRGAKKSREVFLNECGLDPDKKTILFAPIGERYMPNKTIDQEILAILAERDVNIIVRMPPTDIATIHAPPASRANIFFDDAGERSWKRGGSAPSRKTSELGGDDEERLTNELQWSDCVVTGLSTIMIDGAVFDKPIVSVCFDIGSSYWESFKRYHEYDHVRPVLRSGGVRIVYSPDDLRTAVQDYLVYPEKDREGRKRITDEQAYRFDGKSTERLAQVLLQNYKS
jgi:CDP-glycerol glycerophosphotransferase (TagB/SpsB family)